MGRIGFAKRLASLGFSPSLAAMARLRKMRADGAEVIDFGTKIDTPKHIKAAAARYLATSDAALYADPRGIPELRAAIARKLLRENGLSADAETEITVSAGGKHGILTALLALTDDSSEVLLEDPGWLSFEPMVRLAGATPVPVPLREENGFQMDAEDLRSRITPRTRLLVLCNPHNPTGRVMDRAALEAIARVVIAHDLLVIMDEAYEHFIYDGRRHVSMATVAGMRARTVTVYTVSKSFNMFGWRVGWVVAPPAITEQIRIIASHSVTCVNSAAQAGAAAALDAAIAPGEQSLAEMAQTYQTQRDAMVEGLREIAGVSCTLPAGAYFVFPNIGRFGLSSAEVSDRLVGVEQVGSIPGSVFGRAGEGHLRLVFNAPLREIAAGLARLKRFFGSL